MKSNPSRRARPIVLAVAALVAASCSPGSDESSADTVADTPATDAPATDAPATTPTATEPAADGTTPAATSPAATEPAAETGAPTCGTEPVVMNAYFETGFDLPYKLSEEFTAQFPNVTWDIKEDQFSNLMTATPRLLSGENPPDLIRLPSMVSLATDGLLANLDDYATQFGWDQWPEALLLQNRVDDTGIRGSGSLYAMGLNYSLTGAFYNKDLAAQVGMTEPPTTVDEFDAVLAAAKQAGIQPIMAWNASASGGGLAFPLQQLMAAYGPTGPINDWIFQKPGATIDTPTNLQAAEHLQGWIEAGYFPDDANVIEYTDANTRFRAGEGLFIFNGDWENANYNADMGDNVGFMVFPSATGGGLAAMSAPGTYGIAANAEHKDCAAFFFNWVATNEAARQINVDVGGSSPGGPVDLAIPPVEAPITNQTLAAAGQVSADSGQMDFIANATGAIFAEGWTPELQKMIGGEQDAAGLLQTVQAEYESQLEG